MTAIKVATTAKVPVKYLRARCGVRYWEDATVNGERDEDGSRIPCRTPVYDRKKRRDVWCPTIELDTGKILNWPEGTTADIHYKVCDDGDYALLDADFGTVRSIDGYVPNIMCPGAEADGDYVVMTIGADGVIAGWRVDLADFERKEDIGKELLASWPGEPATDYGKRLAEIEAWAARLGALEDEQIEDMGYEDLAAELGAAVGYVPWLLGQLRGKVAGIAAEVDTQG